MDQFEVYLQNEFDEMMNANMLPEEPTVIKASMPPVPMGYEPYVEDLRRTMENDAKDLGYALDFNTFSFDFVCEETVDEIEKVRGIADKRIKKRREKLDHVISDLFLVEREGEESKMVFENRLFEQFENRSEPPATGYDKKEEETD